MERIRIPSSEHWNSRMVFIMAAVGSAIGLGNVWRFPYITAVNGGGAFLIPFFIALFTAGIPLLILEFSIGHWSHKAPPDLFKSIASKWEWFGWWTTLIPFLISLYYVVIMAWCFSYMIYAIDLRWTQDVSTFFLHDFLGITSSPDILGSISIPSVFGLLALWICIFLILYKGVKRIGKVVSLTVPIPIILLLIITIRGLTLPGALEGINYYLTPDFSKLVNVNVWLAAYAQVFFSLGVAQGIMITYAGYLKKTADINNNAVITAFADAGTSFFAGFAVFSVVGYLAAIQGVSIDNLGIAGPFLIFITYPTAINLLPIGAALFGFIFYIALLTFGIDSAFSMIEPITNSLHKTWHFSKVKATALLCGIGFLISLFFTLGSGLYWLEILDHFIANFGLVLIGLFECILLGWLFPLSKLRRYANQRSDIIIGRWWEALIKFVIPIILIILIIVSLYDNIIHHYMGYSWNILLFVGALPIICTLMLSFIFMKKKKKQVLKDA